jgi:hypothetical protein
MIYQGCDSVGNLEQEAWRDEQETDEEHAWERRCDVQVHHC